MKMKLISLILMLGATLASAQTSTVPALLSYQGRVTDSAGTLIGNPTAVNRTVQFKLYTVATAGTAIWGESQTVTISAGEFSVLIGNGTGISGLVGPSSPATSPFKTVGDIINASATAACYLGVTVDDGNSGTTDAEISPRQQLVAGAFALRAVMAETIASGALTSAMIGANAVSTNALGVSAVTTVKIADTSITTAKIADSSITSAKILDGAITAADIDDTSVGLWSVSAGNVYRSAGTGNVGIGNSAPAYKLDVSGTLRASGLITAAGLTSSAAVAALSYVFFTGGDTDTGMFSSGNDVIQLKTGGTDRINIGSGGNVGIGAASAGAKLEVVGQINAAVGTDATSGYAFRGDTDTGMFSSGAEVVKIKTGGTDRMHFTSDGKIGIGITDPKAQLHVFGSAAATSFSQQGYLGAEGAFNTNSNITQAFSILAEGQIGASAVQVSSDARIKSILHLSDGKADLNTLRRIEITDYKYIDRVSNGHAPQKKVIAQQVETVYPLAVSKSTNVVPDLYKTATVADGWVKLATDLKIGERVRLVHDMQSDFFEVLEVRADAFRTALKSADSKIFVYGREVKDFRTVDYDALSMLNISATQELARQLAAKDAAIKSLADENAALKGRLTAMEATDKARDARLAAIEKVLLSADKPMVRTASLKTQGAE